MQNIFTTIDFHGRSVYETCEVRPGVFGTRFLQYLPDAPPTPEQLAEMNAMEAEYAAMCQQFGHEPEEVHFGLFTNEAAAKRATQIHDAMGFAADDVRAFGAPSECLADACRPLQRELESLEEHFGVWGATPDEMHAELLRERNMPAWQALGFRETDRPDDDAIMQAMGERTGYQH